MWEIYYTRQAQKNAKKLTSSGLKSKAEELLQVIAENPYQNPPPYEKLAGDDARTNSPIVQCDPATFVSELAIGDKRQCKIR